jgi:hypothetical protein
MHLQSTLKLVFGFAFGAIMASASSVNFTCDSNIDSLGPASTCAVLNSTIADLYSSTFTNANASIYIEYGNTGLGESSGYENFVNYSTYRSALIAENGSGSVRSSAIASLPGVEPALYGGNQVEVSTALGTALGISGLTGTTAGGAACTIGAGGCYDAVVTLATPASIVAGGNLYYYRTGAFGPTDYDIYSVVEHETDEVLGTSSCIGTNGAALSNGCGSNTPAAVDLFRYNGNGNRVLLSSALDAYFSYNGGATNGANGFVYNTLANGDDYADFISNCPGGPFSVQDGEACPGTAAGLDITNDGGAEINILDAEGYDLNSSPTPSPEPASVWLFGAGLVIFAGYHRRFRRA